MIWRYDLAFAKVKTARLRVAKERGCGNTWHKLSRVLQYLQCQRSMQADSLNKKGT